MKTELLKELGLSEDVIGRIMAENGKDIEAHKGKLAAKEAELEKANQTIGELQAAAKRFDGVDPDRLKGDLAALQAKYDADIAAMKLNGALDAALLTAKARDVRAVKPFLDLNKIKLDGDGLAGLTEQLERIKGEKSYLFEDTPAETPASVRTAMEHGGPMSDGMDGFLSAAYKAAGLSEEKG